jgi:hypothetical protein
MNLFALFFFCCDIKIFETSDYKILANNALTFMLAKNKGAFYITSLKLGLFYFN